MARTSIQTRTHKGAQQGFTLIEMAIAVAIFGLLASGAIMATSAWLGKQALDKTARNLDRIESALTVYMVQNGGLPCPYNNNNVPAGTPVALDCTVVTFAVGIVPYRALGLQRTDVLDGWNRYITYAVDSDWDDVNQWFFVAPPATPLHTLQSLVDPDPLTGGPGASALLDVQDSTATSCITAPATDDPRCAAYVLVSHGEDGNGAYTNFTGGQRGGAPPPAVAVAEGENSDGDATFAAEAWAGDNQFDHIVRFRTPGQILRDAY